MTPCPILSPVPTVSPTFATLSAAAQSADRRSVAMASTADGYVAVFWRGEYLGRLDWVSGSMLAGTLAYRSETWSTDDYHEHGLPDHVVGEKVATFCGRVDFRKAA